MRSVEVSTSISLRSSHFDFELATCSAEIIMFIVSAVSLSWLLVDFSLASKCACTHSGHSGNTTNDLWQIYRLTYLRFASHIRITTSRRAQCTRMLCSFHHWLDHTCVQWAAMLVAARCLCSKQANNGVHESNCLFKQISKRKWTASRICLWGCEAVRLCNANEECRLRSMTRQQIE